MKKSETLCDVCKKVAPHTHKSLDVIFDHDQEDGKSQTKPYFSKYDIDLCEEHHQYLMEGNYLFGYGAMGFNSYSFKKPLTPNAKEGTQT